MGFLQGDWVPHPNSLLFNAFPGFWPLKVFWFFRKVSRTMPPSKSIKADDTVHMILNGIILLFVVDWPAIPVAGLPHTTRGSPR